MLVGSSVSGNASGVCLMLVAVIAVRMDVEMRRLSRPVIEGISVTQRRMRARDTTNVVSSTRCIK